VEVAQTRPFVQECAAVGPFPAASLNTGVLA
jgi:hypothetical protein